MQTETLPSHHDLQLEQAIDLALMDFEIEELSITEVSDSIELPETAASCMGSCACCCSSSALLALDAEL